MFKKVLCIFEYLRALLCSCTGSYYTINSDLQGKERIENQGDYSCAGDRMNRPPI